ncbi:hypothetical protein GALMADRAFT_80522 [Galerina marginata CBS 339.88]|uniref:Zinc finger PHD-type domain-containing protein n=1 Tax=Galerina marginata (strain CBS 339.88) TaxID=685588 RepID=A0A067SG79_GALM3|nr:hypothetical protein GALMADRAFT_80522 [Galerina marginata CBS 339.88]
MLDEERLDEPTAEAASESTAEAETVQANVGGIIANVCLSVSYIEQRLTYFRYIQQPISSSKPPEESGQNPSSSVQIPRPEIQSGDNNQDTPEEVEGRTTRKRRSRAVVYECICGESVSRQDIEAGGRVIECNKAGCETRWFHLDCVELEYAVNNWKCQSCQVADDRPRKRRR